VFTELHRALRAGLTADDALARAQRRVIDDERQRPQLGWAAVTVTVGDRIRD
jgi:hypothetical protein